MTKLVSTEFARILVMCHAIKTERFTICSIQYSYISCASVYIPIVCTNKAVSNNCLTNILYIVQRSALESIIGPSV